MKETGAWSAKKEINQSGQMDLRILETAYYKRWPTGASGWTWGFTKGDEGIRIKGDKLIRSRLPHPTAHN